MFLLLKPAQLKTQHWILQMWLNSRVRSFVSLLYISCIYFFFFFFGLIFRQTLHMPAVTLGNPRLILSSYLEIFEWGKTPWLMQKSRGKSWLSHFWTRAYPWRNLSIRADRTHWLATLGHELIPVPGKAGPCKWQFRQVGVDYFHKGKSCTAEK